MSMFEELFVLARSATLTMTLSADAASGCMTINVVPKPRKDAQDPVLAQALSLTTTPQEFDAGFVDALRNYRVVRQSLAQQAEATQAVIEAARVASAQKAQAQRKTTKAAPAPALPATPVLPSRADIPADDDAGPSDTEEELASGGSDAGPTDAPTPPTGASYDLFA